MSVYISAELIVLDVTSSFRETLKKLLSVSDALSLLCFDCHNNVRHFCFIY